MMIPSRYDLQANESAAEVSALETDIMRFLAIMAFCLMTIFALVQSLPVSSSAAHVDAVKSKTVKLQSDIKDAQYRALQLMVATQRLIIALSDQNEQLSQLSNKLEKQLHDLSGIDKTLSKKQRQIVQWKQINDSAEANVKDINEKLHTIEKQIDDVRGAKRRENTTDNKARENPEPSSQEGYKLTFLSEDIFIKLVVSGDVVLFAQLGNQYYRFKKGNYIKDSVTGKLYAMQMLTVPQLFKRALIANDDNTVNWFVTLPEISRRRISELTADGRGGVLIIGVNGQVSLAPLNN